MIDGLEDAKNVTTQGLDRMMESFGAWSRGVQNAAVEGADFSRKSFEDSASHVQALLGTESLQRAAEVQTEFVRTSYERSLDQATRFADLFTEVAKDMAKPFEGLVTPAR